MFDAKIIKIRILAYRKSDLLMALSEDLPGLVVHARSEDEMKDLLPGAIRDLFEMDGHEVIEVTAVRDPNHVTDDFGPPAFIASASLAAAA